MSKFRRAVFLGLSAMLAPLVAIATAAPAQAWTWTRGVTVYNASNLCVRGDSGIDHFRPGVFSGNLAYANAYGLTGGCGTGLVGWSAAVRLDVWRHDGSGWTICRSTDWVYGTTGTSQWGPTGPELVVDYGGSAACGSGVYGVWAYASVHDGTAWRTGSVWSGTEQVP